MIFMNLSDIAILNIECVDYCCIIDGITKSEAIHLMQNNNLTKKKKRNLTKHKIYYHI